MIKKQGRQILDPNVMIYLAGSKQSFRCECGCNVFTTYENGQIACNACPNIYEGD